VAYTAFARLFPKTGDRFFSLSIEEAGRNGELAMTREERTQKLNALRQENPQRLIATYRQATNIPEKSQLPRGVGFTRMIEAILEHEFAAEELHDEFQPEVEIISMNTNIIVSAARRSVREAAKRRQARMAEFRKFCSGAVLVLTGLLLATVYCMVTHRIAS